MITAHRYSDATCTCRHCVMNLAALINERFRARDLLPLTDDQLDCLCDPARVDEAWGMLDHWEATGWIVGSERGEVAAFLTRHEQESQA